MFFAQAGKPVPPGSLPPDELYGLEGMGTDVFTDYANMRKIAKEYNTGIREGRYNPSVLTPRNPRVSQSNFIHRPILKNRVLNCLTKDYFDQHEVIKYVQKPRGSVP